MIFVLPTSNNVISASNMLRISPKPGLNMPIKFEVMLGEQVTKNFVGSYCWLQQLTSFNVVGDSIIPVI